MQLFALDANQQLIAANHALKQQDYFCLECGDPVRLRGGIHRRDHFYHLQQKLPCRQNGKGMEHLQLQCHIQRSLPNGDCLLEHRFPSINRIADVAWESKRLIFEIQCSPITAIEVAERNRDYESVGWKVVWILHEKSFNQRRLTGAELELKNNPHYYTNFNERGEGGIYDQLYLVKRGQRSQRHPPLPIDVTHPKAPPLGQRSQWHHYFAGDLTDRGLEFLAKEEEGPPLWRSLLACLIRPYQLIFRMLLEGACRRK